MKIRTKSTVFILLLTLFLFLVLQLFTVFVLSPSFNEVDKKEIRNNLIQVKNAIGNDIENLKGLLTDYSSWDDTYNFAQNHNQAYIDDNFVDETFMNLHLNLVAILDNNGNILYNQFFDLNNSIKIPSSNQVMSILQSHNEIFPETTNNATVSGLMLIDNQPMYFISAPILTSQYQGSPMGRMIFGQYIDSDQISKIQNTLNFNFTIEPLINFQQEHNQIAGQLESNPQTSIIEENSSERMSGYILMNEIHNDSTIVLTVTNQRVAYQEGQIIQYLFLGAAILFSSATAIGSFLLMESTVVKPMKSLAYSVKAMPLNSSGKKRNVNMGSDELNLVSSAVSETLDKKFEAMNDVSRMVAHDLRNPLAGIKNANYILNKKYGTMMGEDGKLMLEAIAECVEYSNKIVTDLLDFSTEIKLDKVESTPKQLVDSSLMQFKLESNVEIITDTSDDFKVFVDRERIMRVFSNLIKNAIDAMPSGGKLLITNRRRAKNQVVIDFVDSGIGMSKDTLEKLWTPFFTTKAKGMGVGLAVCKKIVEAHGGKIEVDSTINKGTTFSVYLPIA
jgi:signal transduction histidine kinase